MPGSILRPMARPAESQPTSAAPPAGLRANIGRMLPLAVVVAATATVLAMGWHRHLSLEYLVKHRAAIDLFVMIHGWMAIAAFMLLYVAVVALSIPGATVLTIVGGLVFGTLVSGVAVVIAATIGATIIFLIARSALGELLLPRAGSLVETRDEGFGADAFND